MNDKLYYERRMIDEGRKYLAGMDEAGRGPLAGPVVAACVILPLDDIIAGIDDSKKLSEKKREDLYYKIIKKATAYGVGIIGEGIIDKINILNATKLAMKNAYYDMRHKADCLLVDAIDKLDVDCDLLGIIKGDSLSYLIGAASIIAKVTRDNIMREYEIQYPGYCFEKHKGYPTRLHYELLEKHGPCEIHRKSFLKKIVNE